MQDSLNDLLCDGMVEVESVSKSARQGPDSRHYFGAKKDLGVVARHPGITGPWFWELPAQGAHKENERLEEKCSNCDATVAPRTQRRPRCWSCELVWWPSSCHPSPPSLRQGKGRQHEPSTRPQSSHPARCGAARRPSSVQASVVRATCSRPVSTVGTGQDHQFPAELPTEIATDAGQLVSQLATQRTRLAHSQTEAVRVFLAGQRLRR